MALEHTVLSCEHDVDCRECGARPVEVFHELESETAQWTCDHCGAHNEERVPDCTEPDPDEAHDERHFQ